jgi:hypothetical protein
VLVSLGLIGECCLAPVASLGGGLDPPIPQLSGGQLIQEPLNPGILVMAIGRQQVTRFRQKRKIEAVRSRCVPSRSRNAISMERGIAATVATVFDHLLVVSCQVHVARPAGVGDPTTRPAGARPHKSSTSLSII